MKQLRSVIILLSFLLLTSFASEAGTVKGRMLMIDGTTPFSNGMVLFFDSMKGEPPDPRLEVRPPDFTESLDSNGEFDLVLPPGKYYFGAIKRQDSDFGPPQSGDMFFINRDWYITVTREENVELGDMAMGRFYQ